MDIYTAAGLQPLYRYPGTARTSNTNLVKLVETTTTIASMFLYYSLSLLHTDSPSNNSSPSFPFLVLTSNRYNSHRAANKTTQVTYPA
jgi:hypothetical protein